MNGYCVAHAHCLHDGGFRVGERSSISQSWVPVPANHLPDFLSHLLLSSGVLPDEIEQPAKNRGDCLPAGDQGVEAAHGKVNVVKCFLVSLEYKQIIKLWSFTLFS